jgi:spoIIIJ-associated protein
MAGFLRKLFGGGKKQSSEVEGLAEKTLAGIIEKAGLELSFDLSFEKSESESVLSIEFSGADEEALKDKKGELLDAFQLVVKRVLQHHFPEDKTTVLVDAGGYREETEKALIDKAENLKQMALEQGRSVYYRALPPKERKVVHQYLAQDPRIKSRSLGDGLYKKIKIYPVKNPDLKSEETAQES